MSYTNVPKPTGTNYTNISHGLVYYDDVNVTYDDPNTFYDGFNPNAYTNVAKPVGASYTLIPKPV